MAEKLRFTGEWPPMRVLKAYPNWEYALDEEGVEGQDETTIRPEAQQNVISGDTAYTAAEARQADGTERRAIVAIVGGRIDAVDVYVTEVDTWRVGRVGDRWEPFLQSWLPESQRMPCVSLSDTTIFPLRVTTVLPEQPTGRPLSEEIK
jgi:hypothetical protein